MTKVCGYNTTIQIWTSGHDGGIVRYISPPCTNKRRTTVNLKTKNNQNCQKIELYGSLTIKELKKKHSSRLVGGAEMGMEKPGWRRLVRRWKLLEQAVPYLCAENWEEQLQEVNQGARQIAQSRVPVQGNKASKSLTEKTCGV